MRGEQRGRCQNKGLQPGMKSTVGSPGECFRVASSLRADLGGRVCYTQWDMFEPFSGRRRGPRNQTSVTDLVNNGPRWLFATSIFALLFCFCLHSAFPRVAEPHREGALKTTPENWRGMRYVPYCRSPQTGAQKPSAKIWERFTASFDSRLRANAVEELSNGQASWKRFDGCSLLPSVPFTIGVPTRVYCSHSTTRIILG